MGQMHKERRGLCEEARGTARIALRGTRSGEDRAKRPERVAPRVTRSGEDRAKRHEEQERERCATKNGNGKVPCRNEQEWRGTPELTGTWRKGVG